MTATTAVYVYGVVDSGTELELDDAGLGPVRLVEHGPLAALCSDVGSEPPGRRRELKAHADVLGASCLRATVVPFSFGTVLGDDDEVRTRLLRDHQAHLTGELSRLRDLLQLNLRVVPNEERLLADLVAGSPELAGLRRSTGAPGATQAQQLRLGEAVAHAYRVTGEGIGRAVLDALAGGAVDVRVEDMGGPEATTRAAFLVARDRVSDFLDEAQRVAEGLKGRVTCRVVGPLPPFTFVQPLDREVVGGATGPERRHAWAS
jgi:hypothetical protein